MEDVLIARILVLLLALSVPTNVKAAEYVVRPGDTLSQIAARHHVSLRNLADVNGISDPYRLQVGTILSLPAQTSGLASGPASSFSYPVTPGSYRVRWGDTLLGLSSRFHLSISVIRSLNPSLGRYLIAGQMLNVCSSCIAGVGTAETFSGPGAGGRGGWLYTVRPGDTLSGIAIYHGVSQEALLASNHIPNPHLLVVGTQLTIPSVARTRYVPAVGDAMGVRSLIVSYSQQYGVDPSLALAVGARESAYNQNAISRTGAIGVMQVEPYTAREISRLLGRPINLYSLEDNVQAGVFWLSHLLTFYGWNERLAVAAYYQGTQGVAKHGFYRDTLQYVNDVLALKVRVRG